MEWSKEDMDRARLCVALIRNPRCTEAEALELMIGQMDIAECAGRINGVEAVQRVFGNGKAA